MFKKLIVKQVHRARRQAARGDAHFDEGSVVTPASCNVVMRHVHNPKLADIHIVQMKQNNNPFDYLPVKGVSW